MAALQAFTLLPHTLRLFHLKELKLKTVKEWLNEINIQKLIGYYQTMYPAYLDDTRLDEMMTIRQCRDLERSKLPSIQMHIG